MTVKILTVLSFTLLLIVDEASAQVLGTNYTWADSATVNVTGRDSTFSRIWEEVNIRVTGGDGYIRIGAPDTSAWSSRKWQKIIQGETFSFGPGTKLRRLQFKSSTGLVTFWFVGYKKKWQVGTGN